MVTIRLPWPPKETSPNASRQGNWRAKAKAAKTYKTTCAWECRAQKVLKMLSESVTVSITFHAPDNHSMIQYDLDNALLRAKQGLDAVAEAIGIDDCHWDELRLIRGSKVSGGCIVVEITGRD